MGQLGFVPFEDLGGFGHASRALGEGGLALDAKGRHCKL